MNLNTLFKIQCGLYVAAVGLPEKMSGCITNTLMEQSHVPVRLSLTIEKSHLTRDLIAKKGSVGVSALSEQSPVDLIRRFGFVSGRDSNKFEGITEYTVDDNGNPVLHGPHIAANFSLTVQNMVDMGTHTMFICSLDGEHDFEGNPITYWAYRESMRKK